MFRDELTNRICDFFYGLYYRYYLQWVRLPVVLSKQKLEAAISLLLVLYIVAQHTQDVGQVML